MHLGHVTKTGNFFQGSDFHGFPVILVSDDIYFWYDWVICSFFKLNLSGWAKKSLWVFLLKMKI